jgi:hypothetical protein
MPKITKMKIIGQTKKIEINGKKITIKKLSLRKIAQLFEQIKSLPKEITSLDTMTNDQIMERLPMILAGLMPAIAGIIVNAVDDKEVTEEFLLDECGLDDNLEIIKSVLEVNNVDKIFLYLKSIKGLGKKSK